MLTGQGLGLEVSRVFGGESGEVVQEKRKQLGPSRGNGGNVLRALVEEQKTPRYNLQGLLEKINSVSG